jgi:hypothetical protein
MKKLIMAAAFLSITVATPGHSANCRSSIDLVEDSMVKSQKEIENEKYFAAVRQNCRPGDTIMVVINPFWLGGLCDFTKTIFSLGHAYAYPRDIAMCVLAPQ